MKIVSLTPDEEAVVAKLRRDALKAKEAALGGDAVRAAGTSEGAKKGWSTRIQGGVTHYHMRGEKGDYFVHQVSDRDGQGFKDRWTVGMIGKNMLPDSAVGGVHDSSAAAKKVCEDHDCGITKAADATATDVVHCRAHSSVGPALGASQPWQAGDRVEFMWMPAGVSTITAGFRKGSIELTVLCDETTASAVQASLDAWREDRPKQEPFGCIEHKEQEASFRVGASCGFAWRNDGVYLAAEPTTLGAQNVNGKVHRSWSPSFTTDADYSKASEQGGVLVFPEGVRGSRSNPARITGVDFCVGTLTNKPAFHSMSPVKARESDAVTAAGTSEGAKKGWEGRHGYAGGLMKLDQAKKFYAEKGGGEEGMKHLWGILREGNPHRRAPHPTEAFSHNSGVYKSYRAPIAELVEGLEAPAEFGSHSSKYPRTKKSMESSNEIAGLIHQQLGSSESSKATDSASTDSVRAHCRLTLLQDVPDATDAEVAQYEKEVEGGGSHSDAVIRLRSARQNGFKTTGSEKPTLDTIAAKHAAALEAANRIAAERGAAKLTAADVYERFSVKATGTSEGVKKGWENRHGFTAGRIAIHKKAQREVYIRTLNKKTGEAEIESMSGHSLGKIHADNLEPLKAKASHHSDDADERAQADEDRYPNKATDATPEAILERIYARAGASR